MKRLALSSLALLLVTGSMGQVFAAAFCPRASGHECCFSQTLSHTHSSSFNHEDMAAHDMHMDGMSHEMNMNDMELDHTSVHHRAMNHTVVGAATVDMPIPLSPSAFGERGLANRFDPTFESCAHCMGHSGAANGPVSFARVSGQSGKDVGSLLLPVSSFLVRPPLTLAQFGLPREHGPPGTSAPRHILISVFLI